MKIRILTATCFLLGMAAFALITGTSAVKVKCYAPRLVNPGDEFMVRISIDKASLTKGAVLQQILPDGFTATPIENDGAKFDFANQMVRYVWDNLPSKNVLVLAYKVKASEDISGMKRMNGTFVYADNNKTEQLSLPANVIYLSNDYPVSNAEQTVEPRTSLSVNRYVENKSNDTDNEYRITIEVNNQNETGFASWTQEVPDGYRVEVNQANNAEYNTEPGLVHFTWKEMPAEKSWSFVYSFISSEGTKSIEASDFAGLMLYGSMENAYTCSPVEMGTPVKANKSFLAGPAMNTNQNTASASAELNTPTPAPVPDPQMTPSISRGTYYRVQIAATRRSPVRDSRFFESRYQISHAVDMIEQDGWRKYCIGTFARIEPARTFALETRSHIPDAFVVAYRDGQRIPVNEAMETLSLSN